MGYPRRVLVGTDGSPRAEEAVRQAAILAAAAGGTLGVVAVLDPDRPHGADLEKETDRALGRAGDIARGFGVVADRRVLAGDVVETLMSESSRRDCDLLAVGQDSGILGGALRVGRVAKAVAHGASIPVLIARGADAAFPGRVLAAVDGSEASRMTASRAAAISSATGAELRLLHVIPTFRGDAREWTLRDDESSPAGLAEGVRSAVLEGVTPLREMAMGRPEHAIVAVAARESVGLVVVGQHGRSGLRHNILGSVSDHVAGHATCSVLVVRASS